MSGHTDGFRSLGTLIAGGDPRPGEKAFLEGLNTGSTIRSRNAATESALAQARLRRDEAKDRAAFRALGPEAIDPISQLSQLSGFNPEQLTGAALERQELGFRETIADPATARDVRQFAAQGVEGRVVDPIQFGPGGDLLTDVFSADPLGTVAVTETGTQAILTDKARQEAFEATAALKREQAANPEAFRTTFGFGPTGAADPDAPGLGDEILASIPDSTIPAGVDPRAATGPRGAILSAANIPADILNLPLPFPDTSKAEETMAQLAKRITIQGQQAMPGRPNVKVIDIMQSFGVEPGDFTRGDQRTFDLMVETSRFLGAEVDAARLQINSGRIPRSQFAQFERSLRSLAGLKKDFDFVIARFEATGEANTTEDGTPFTLKPAP